MLELTKVLFTSLLIIHRLTNLRGIEALEQLDWLDASGNRLASVGSLEANVMLRYLDFSDNHIVDLPNLSMLFRLKVQNYAC